MNTLKTWVKSRWFTHALGLLLIAALIWVGGPYVGIGEREPLASAAARVALILAVVLAWVIALQVLQWRAQRKTARLSGDLAGQETQLAAAEPGSEERAQLLQRFREAIHTLRKTRRNGNNLYALPWYVVIGRPARARARCCKTPVSTFRCPSASARTRCAVSAAHATATGGSPTRPCFSTPRAATRRRIPTRKPMQAHGSRFSRCCAAIAGAGR